MVRNIVVMRIRAVEESVSAVRYMIDESVRRSLEQARLRRMSLIREMEARWESRKMSKFMIHNIMIKVELRIDAKNIVDGMVAETIARTRKKEKELRLAKANRLREEWGKKTIARGLLEVILKGMKELTLQEDPWEEDEMDQVLENVMMMLEGGLEWEQELELCDKPAWPSGEKRKRGRKLSHGSWTRSLADQKDVKSKLVGLLGMDKDRLDMNKMVRELEEGMENMRVDSSQSDLVRTVIRLMGQLTLTKKNQQDVIAGVRKEYDQRAPEEHHHVPGEANMQEPWDQ